MKYEGAVKKRIRAVLPAVLSVTVLGVTVYRVAVQRTKPVTADIIRSTHRTNEGSLKTVRSGETGPIPDSPQLLGVPCSTSIVGYSVVRSSNGFRHDLRWYLDDQDIPELLDFLEHDPRSLSYRVERKNRRWYAEAQVAGSLGAVVTDTGGTRHESVAAAFTSGTTVSVGTPVSKRRTPRQDDRTGYVRFEDRGTMYWLWDDAEALHLESER